MFLQVIHKRVTRMVSTDLHLRQDEWDSSLSAVRMSGSRERRAQLRIIDSKVKWNANRIADIISRKE